MAEGRTNFAIAEHDFYTEPQSSTAHLIARERLRHVWDPACGSGNVVKACLAAGIEAVGSDLIARPCVADEPWFLGAADFLATSAPPAGVKVICTNPPYGSAKLAEAFIRHALTMDVHKVCAFVNSKFLFGSGRAQGLYRDHPPLRIYPISPRPSCPPGDWLLAGNKAGGGVENFMWCTFVRGRLGTSAETIW